jgi:hypothetical protein
MNTCSTGWRRARSHRWDAGWHPFAAALSTCFQPNDTHMNGDSDRVMVLTGPNCSGKSVYLQQVGIIVLLAHIGCFVPASYAEIGLVDRITARTNQDGARMESFAADLVHVSNILRLSTDRTLVLIDEIGKVGILRAGLCRPCSIQRTLIVFVVQGTLPLDGAALLIATLSNFSLRPTPPRLICVTHCMETTDSALLPQCVLG